MKESKTYGQIWQQLRDFSRLKIHGGWLVYSNTEDDNGGESESLVYVPDINHEWEIK